MKRNVETASKPINKKLLLGIVGGILLVAVVAIGIALLLSGNEVQFKLSPQSITLAVGEQEQLQIIDEGDGNIIQAQWRSDALSVVTVDDGGCITAVGPGQARITAVVSQNGINHAAFADIIVSGDETSKLSVDGASVTEVERQFLLSQKTSNVTAYPIQGRVEISDKLSTTHMRFAARMGQRLSDSWELSGTIAKDVLDVPLFMSFGVIDENNKDQWFCILDEAMSLQRYWNWWDTKYQVDGDHVTTNQVSEDFFYRKRLDMSFKIVVKDDIMRAYFGASPDSLKLTWELPLTEETFGGFAEGSKYQLAINIVDPNNLIIDNLKVISGDSVELGPEKMPGPAPNLLSVWSGKVSFKPGPGIYYLGDGDATAVTSKTYKEAELTVEFCPNTWPIQGFAVRQGDNMVTFRFGSEGYNTYYISTQVNGVTVSPTPTTAFPFSLYGAYSYDMKLTYDGEHINMYTYKDGAWQKLNRTEISLASILGDQYDPETGISVGIAGFSGCGRQFKGVSISTKVTTKEVIKTKPVSSLSELNGKYGHYYLIGDISGNTTTVSGFTGTLDCGGYTIETSVPLFDELNVTTLKNANVHLTKSITAQGVIAGAINNSTVENVHITAANGVKLTGPEGQHIGGFAGSANTSKFINCSSAVEMVGTNQAGGIVGQSTGATTIDGCVNSGAISALEAGGIVGRMQGGRCSISDSTNKGDITASGSSQPGAAGIISYVVLGSATIDGCTNHGTISSENGPVGGIAGYCGYEAQLTVLGSVNNGEVTGVRYCGGLLGQLESRNAKLVAKNVTNNGDVSSHRSSAECGGMIGRVFAGSKVQLELCTNTGDISAANAGGMVAFAHSNAVETTIALTGCTNGGAIVGTNVGGMMGKSISGVDVSVSGCVNNGSVDGTYAGGVVGMHQENATLVIEDWNGAHTVNNGDITGSSKAGGMVGWALTADVTISGAVNTGTITGPQGNDADAGGMVGRAQMAMAIITDAVNEGNISAWRAGGIVGAAFDNHTRIDDPKNSGDIGTASVSGGIIGFVSEGLLSVNNYVNTGTVTGNATGDIYGSVRNMTPNIDGNQGEEYDQMFGVYDGVSAVKRAERYAAAGLDGTTTVFIGDSFFDTTEGFWRTYAADLKGKDALVLGIGGSTAEDWIAYLERGLFMDAIAPKNVVINLGNNDIFNDYLTAEAYCENYQKYIGMLRNEMPEANIYVVSIVARTGSYTNDTLAARCTAANKAMSAWCAEQAKVTYVDVTGYNIQLRDNIHPQDAYYSSAYLPALEAAGCMIEDSTNTENPNGPLAVWNGNVTYDSVSGQYSMGDGDATAVTAESYKAAEMLVAFCPNTYPIQGFAVKQGENVITFNTGSEGYNTGVLFIERNGTKLSSGANASGWTPYGNNTYYLKLTWDGTYINLYVKQNNAWVAINENTLVLANLFGEGFDAEAGVQIGIAGFEGCGRQFGNISISETITRETEYTIIYDGVEGATHSNSETVEAGAQITLADASKDGYMFLGWYDGGGNKVETLTVNSDIILTAKWAKYITSLSELNGQSGAFALNGNITNDATVANFGGTLYGNGKTVSTSVSLFAALGNGVVIEDLTVDETADITGGNMGIICSGNTSEFKNIQFTNITLKSTNGSKLNGTSNSGAFMHIVKTGTVFTNCVNHVDVVVTRGGTQGTGVVGGFVANAQGATFKDCTNYGEVICTHTANGANVGGFAGATTAGTAFTGCTNYGNVTSTGGKVGAVYNAGGIIGSIAAGTTVTDCMSTGIVTGTAVGNNGDITVTFITALSELEGKTGIFALSGDITNSETVASFSGTLYGSDKTISTSVPLFTHLANGAAIENLTIDLTANVTDGMGVLCSGNTGEFKNIKLTNITLKSSNGSKLTCGSNSGAFMHIAKAGTVFNDCVNYVAIESTRSSTTDGFFGGFVANAEGAKFVNCTNYANITANHTGSINMYVGGFVGRSNGSTYTNCVNKGVISSDVTAAGFIGQSTGDTVTGCTNKGTITGTVDGGGIIGYLHSGNITISDCTVTEGNISGRTGAGSLAARYSSGLISVTITGNAFGTNTVTAGGTVYNTNQRLYPTSLAADKIKGDQKNNIPS